MAPMLGVLRPRFGVVMAIALAPAAAFTTSASMAAFSERVHATCLRPSRSHTIAGASAGLKMGLFDFLKPVDVRDSAPAQWEEVVDETSGRTFFWNKATGDTAWEKPEQQVALVNRFRDEIPASVAQDDLPFSSELLVGTYLQGRKLECFYRATRDGWTARQFHELCDVKGPCVVVGTTDAGARFGAFNPEGWCSDDDYRNNLNAFLFFWPQADPEAGPVKLAKIGGGDAAVFDYARSGPHFGADGLVIGESQAATTGLFAGPDTDDLETAQGQLQQARSRLGQSYARIPAAFSPQVKLTWQTYPCFRGKSD